MPWDAAELRIGRVTAAGIEQEQVLLGDCLPSGRSAAIIVAHSDGWVVT